MQFRESVADEPRTWSSAPCGMDARSGPARASCPGAYLAVPSTGGHRGRTRCAASAPCPRSTSPSPTASCARRRAPRSPRTTASTEFQWNLKLIGAERTWAIQKGKPEVAVAILDTGIAYEDFGPYRKAPDFGGTVFIPGFDFVNNDAHANDDEFHGTHVASTVAEATNNSLGVAGFAFGCALMPVKVLNATGDGSFFDVAQGIEFATNYQQGGTNPVKVINMSLGGDGPSASGQPGGRQGLRARNRDRGLLRQRQRGDDRVSRLACPR